MASKVLEQMEPVSSPHLSGAEPYRQRKRLEIEFKWSVSASHIKEEKNIYIYNRNNGTKRQVRVDSCI